MTEYVSIDLSISEFVSAIGRGDLDHLFNELGYYHDEPNILEILEKEVGSELNDEGKRFLLAIKEFCERQFPGEVLK